MFHRLLQQLSMKEKKNKLLISFNFDSFPEASMIANSDVRAPIVCDRITRLCSTNQPLSVAIDKRRPRRKALNPKSYLKQVSQNKYQKSHSGMSYVSLLFPGLGQQVLQINSKRLTAELNRTLK